MSRQENHRLVLCLELFYPVEFLLVDDDLFVDLFETLVEEPGKNPHDFGTFLREQELADIGTTFFLGN